MNTAPEIRDPEGIHNFRALAPYPLRDGGAIRGGMIYRSGALDLMTEADAACLSDEVGLRTILDLRHPDELAHAPHSLTDRAIALSIFPEGATQESLIAELNGLYGTGPRPERYFHYLMVGGDRMAQAFGLFAEEATYPILVHCTAGKDRTGVLLALLMDVLGADDADIASEYALSDAGIERLIAYLRASGRTLEGTEDEIRARLACPPERATGFIELVRERWGSAEGFFLSHGISEAQIARVRELLVEA